MKNSSLFFCNRFATAEGQLMIYDQTRTDSIWDRTLRQLTPAQIGLQGQ